MDITNINQLLPSSPYQALEKHRFHMLDAINLLSRQLCTTYLTNIIEHTGRPFWLTDLPWQTEHQEQETIASLQRPFLKSRPKEAIAHLIQAQSCISQLTFRIAERLSYPATIFPNTLKQELAKLCYFFDDACQSLKSQINDQNSLFRPRYIQRGKRKKTLSQIYHQQTLFSKHVDTTSHKLRRLLVAESNKIPVIDNVLLTLTLDDLSELMGRVRSFLSILLRY